MSAPAAHPRRAGSGPGRRAGADTVLRALLIGFGVGAAGWGAYLVLSTNGPRIWLSIAFWLAAGSVAHDLVIAPVSLALGRLMGRALGRPTARGAPGNALRGGWLLLGVVVLVGTALVEGGKIRRNPTVIPGDPVLNVLASIGLVVAGVLAVLAVSAVRGRRATRREPPAAAAAAAST